eukprot:5798728-Amphidinium_carterae.1
MFVQLTNRWQFMLQQKSATLWTRFLSTDFGSNKHHSFLWETSCGSIAAASNNYRCRPGIAQDAVAKVEQPL